MERVKPNVLVTGTPGTGKTSLCQRISEEVGLNHLNIGELVQKEQCHEGKDLEFDAYILDDDKLCDALEPYVIEGGQVVDFHSCDLFPVEWFDLVLVLRSQTDVLFDRLTSRGYSKKKLDENMECEIMQIVLEEAREAFPEEMVHELPSNNIQDLESNIGRLKAWYATWLQEHT